MAINKIPESFTYAADAAVDHSSNINKLAVINSDGKIALCGDGAKPFGTLIEVDIADRPVTVQFGGIAKVVLGGTVTVGNNVASAASGLGVVAAAGDHLIGIALASGVSSDVIPVAIIPGLRET